MATKKSQPPTTQNKPLPIKVPPPPPPKSSPKPPKGSAAKPPAPGEKSAGKILPFPTSGNKTANDKSGQANKPTNTPTTRPSQQNTSGAFESGSVAQSQRPEVGTDAPQKRGRAAERRAPTNTGRQDYEYTLERMAYDSPLVRRFVKRLKSQRDLVDGFLNSTPSLQLVLNKMFMEFGRDEEEDKQLIRAVSLHLKGRGGGTVEQETPEPEPEMPTEEEIQRVRDFPALYEEWNTDPEAFQRELDGLVEQRRELLRTLRYLSGAERDQLSDVIKQLDTAIEQRRAILEGRATEYYATLIENVFAYNIEFGDQFQGENPEGINALTNLADTSFYIVDYLNERGVDGLSVFREYFAQVPGEGYNPVDVTIGADAIIAGASNISEHDASYRGNVPLSENSNAIFLGSRVSIPTTVHEFFHQFDRYLRVQASEGFDSFLNQTPNTLNEGEFLDLSLIGTNTILQNRANTGEDPDDENNQEYFADLAMSATLDGRGLTISPDPNATNTVGFLPNRTNAKGIECAFTQYMEQILRGVSNPQLDLEQYLQCVG